jgi:hypothetical protein
MVHRLVRVDPLQAAKISAALYFLVGLLVTPFFYFSYVIAPAGLGFTPGLIVGLPFLYAGVGFAFTALGCAVYNALARRLGGVEIELSTEPAA